MGGILAMPSWVLFSSQESLFFFSPRALSDRPLTNLTITEARSTGLPRSLVTWICNRVRSSALSSAPGNASARSRISCRIPRLSHAIPRWLGEDETAAEVPQRDVVALDDRHAAAAASARIAVDQIQNH